jgi:hypothetical protein
MRRFRLSPPHRAIGAGIVLLAVVAWFLVFGPVGLGNGPLIAQGSAPGTALILTRPAGQTAVYVAELTNSAHAAAHIDSVAVKSAAGSGTPEVLSIRVGHFVRYPCITVATVNSLADCVQTRLVPAGGFAVPARANAVTGYVQGPTLVIEFTAPTSARCGVINTIVVHYHVGIRHYAAAIPQGTAAMCPPGAKAPSS